MSNIVKIFLVLSLIGLIVGIICIAFGNISVAGIVWAATVVLSCMGYKIEKRNKSK